MRPRGRFVHGAEGLRPAAEETLTGARHGPLDNAAMARVALIEDDLPTSNQLAGWIRGARAGTEIDQLFDRDGAEAALARSDYDVVLLDIELGRERRRSCRSIPCGSARPPGAANASTCR